VEEVLAVADGTEKVRGTVATLPPSEHLTDSNSASAHGAAHRSPEFPGAPVLATARPLPTRRDRWNLWNWRVRTKLFAVLMIPAIAAVILGSLQVSAELAGVRDLGRIVTQVEVGVKVADVVHEVQRERELMAGFVANNRSGDRSPLDVQKRRVDGLVSGLQVAGARLQGMDDLGRTSYQQALASVGALRTLREVSETTKYSDQAVITSYSAMISSLLTLHREVTKATSSHDMGNIGGAADALSRAKEQIAQQHAVLLVAGVHGRLLPNEVQAVRVADSRHGAALTEFFSVASAEVRQLYADTVTGPEVDMRERIKQGAVQAALAGRPPGINLTEWDNAAGQTADLMNKVEASLNSQLRTTALKLREQAGAGAVRDATILLGSLFATLLLVVVVARSMLVPLRTLRDTAFKVADRKLPDAIRRIRDADEETPDITVEPVAVQTREEIGQVARAFDAVHGEAVRLASEQSLLRRNVNDMFVNLSRRSQGLVERQLHLIDNLENTEQDPEQLSNLFQLDHLATRMRRNSENLLVLAGAELQRRSTRPVPAVDVLRAAVSEVEEYQRVIVQTPPPVNVLGLVVNDLVHLIAELLDNATTFSPPDTRVVVRSMLSEHGDLIVEISDQGVGMPYELLVEANQRLAEPPVVDVSVSRRMGLFVVGRLAGRHGVAVRLGGNEGEPGLTAMVAVPADLIQAGEYGEFGPRTDQVPTPRTSEQPARYEPAPDDTVHYDLGQEPQEPAWQSQPDDWPAAGQWPPDEAAPEQQTPYPARESVPMQVSMVDSMSGSDLFTPAAVPNLNVDGGMDIGVDTSADRALREIFGEDYPTGDAEPGLWPDTDQDVHHTHAAPPVAPEHPAAAVPPAEPARPAAEDHLGVGQQMPRVQETTPIYEEMVSAWFRELTPPAPSVARPAPNYVEPPPFELPAAGSVYPPQVPWQEQPYPAYRHEPAYRPEPVAPRPEPGSVPQPPPVGEPSSPAAAGQPQPEPAIAGGRGRHAAPGDRWADQPADQRPDQPAAQTAQAGQPQAAEQPVATGNGDVWHSPADEGWLAASALTTVAHAGFTAAGLPKRKRGAHLVPGAAAPPSPPAVGTPRRSRSADDVRGRLANYQQGLRQGREFRRGMAHASREHGQEPPAQHATNEESQ
jgi:signal transduction histidine kinase